MEDNATKTRQSKHLHPPVLIGLLAGVVTMLVVLSARIAAAPPPTQGPAAPRAYVANQDSNNVSVIDTGTHIVVATVNVGTQPRAVAVTPNGTRAYVVNFGSNNVSVIDTITNTVVATVNVGNQPWDVAITPNGSRAYVTNTGSQSVSVIDTATNSVVTNVPLGSIGSPSGGREPHGLAITPNGSHVYVASHGSGSVWVIATSSNTVAATINVGGQPLGVAIGNTVNGTRAYVTHDSFPGMVSVITTATNSVVTTLNFANPATAVAVTPDGTRAYVSHLFSSDVSIISTANNSVTPLPVGNSVLGVAFAPDGSFGYMTTNANQVRIVETATNDIVGVVHVGSAPAGVAIAPAPPGIAPPPGPGPAPRAYVTNRTTQNVSVIDTGTNALVANVRVGSTPFGVAVTLDGSRAYVTNQASNNVSVINTTTNTVVQTVPVGSSPTGIAITPDGSRVYVTNQASNNVSVIDTTNNNIVVQTFGVGSAPSGVAIANTANGTRAYVTNQGSFNVSVINTANNSLVTTIPVGFFPFGVAVTPDGTRAYVANFSAGTVSVINTSTNTVIAAVTVGGAPRYVAVAPDGADVYVSIGSSVKVIDRSNNNISATITGGTFIGLAFTPDGARAYAADGSQSVKVVDTDPLSQTANTIVGNVPVGGINPEGVAIMQLPTLSIDDVSVTKGSSGTTDAIFTVNLSGGPSTQTVTVDFATADGTALSGMSADYQSNSGTLTFTPGESSKNITVLVNGNTLSGPDKTFFVNLSNATNAAIADAQGMGTIISGNNGTANLDISASGSPDPIDTGSILRYVVNVTNNGPADATGVSITYVMPAEAVFDSVTTRSTGVGCTVPAVDSSGTVTCDFGTMAAGTTKGVSIMVKPQTAGTLSSTFGVAGNEPDSDTSNNSITVTTTVNLAPAVINVTENIVVSDSPGVLPSAMIGVSENIVVTDAPGVLPSAMIGVAENIVVSDAPGVLPSAMIGVNENIVVADAPSLGIHTGGEPTPTGTPVTVQPRDINGVQQPVNVTFGSVTQAGLTFADPAVSPSLPPNFSLNGVMLDIHTTAQYTSPVVVCFFGTFTTRDRLLHYENGAWVDVTYTQSRTELCGLVTSLSPFAAGSYTVQYLFSGFFQPVENLPVINVAKAGSTVPVKWQLKTADGALVSDISSIVSLTSAPMACDASPSDVIEEQLTSAGDAIPHFDGTQWVFNWKTTKGWTGCRLLQLTLADGTQHFAKFRFK